MNDQLDELQKAYLVLQDNCGIKVGDTVRVLRKAEDMEMGWDNGWTGTMDRAIGKKATVVRICDAGIGLDITGYNYPFFVLEKLTPDWTEKLCEEVPALCRVWDYEEARKSSDLINGSLNNKLYAFSGENCNWRHAELVPKELLQAMLERYYD